MMCADVSKLNNIFFYHNIYRTDIPIHVNTKRTAMYPMENVVVQMRMKRIFQQ